MARGRNDFACLLISICMIDETLESLRYTINSLRRQRVDGLLINILRIVLF